jgi:hypothetical protein
MIKLLALLISISAQAATPGAVPSVTVSAPGANTGSVSIPPSDLSGAGTHGIFSLFIGIGSDVLNDFYPFIKSGTGAAYQVTAGKTAYCFDGTSSGSPANSLFQLVSATSTFANAASSLTGGVYQSGSANLYPWTTGSTINVQGINPGVYSFGATTWPGIQAGGTSTTAYTIHMDCFEQ